MYNQLPLVNKRLLLLLLLCVVPGVLVYKSLINLFLNKRLDAGKDTQRYSGRTEKKTGRQTHLSIPVCTRADGGSGGEQLLFANAVPQCQE